MRSGVRLRVGFVCLVVALPLVAQRQVGIRPTGAYWGAGPEQIDTLSGNLNFSMPVLELKTRAGFSRTLMLTYNSQNWVREPNGTVSKAPVDLGYGYGWRLSLGTVRPVTGAGGAIVGYEYIDGSGAEYLLNVNTNNVWTGMEGVYVAFEAATNKLRFYDGTIYEMGCVSGSGEPDAGTRHVTRVIDPNGNYFTLTYLAGAGGGGPNTSARINTAVDVTRINGISESPIYFMHYGYLQIGVNAAEPHFRQLFFTPAAVTTPWGTPAGTQRLLTSIYGTYGANHTLQYTGFGELNTVTFPYGGRLRWEHRNFTYSTGRTIREVNWRGLIQTPGGAETAHGLYRDDAGDVGRPRHYWLVIAPQDGMSDRAWWFDVNTGRPFQFAERKIPEYLYPKLVNYAWATTASGHPYVSEVLTTLDYTAPSQRQSKVTQAVDANGNVVQQKEYDFDLSEANARIYTHVYASYGSTYYRRFLQSTTLQQGSWSKVLVSNQYFLGYPYTYVNESNLRLWDPSYKMNHAKHLVAHDRPGHSARFLYYPTGDVSSATVNGLAQYNTLNAQLAVPTQITASGLSTTLNWNGVLQLTSEVGPNGDTVSFNWSADRPTQTTSPHGAQTNYTYSYSPARTEAKTGNRWTRSYHDGLGRTVRVEKGYTSGSDVIDSNRPDGIRPLCLLAGG